jgi:hypothetical protein
MQQGKQHTHIVHAHEIDSSRLYSYSFGLLVRSSECSRGLLEYSGNSLFPSPLRMQVYGCRQGMDRGRMLEFRSLSPHLVVTPSHLSFYVIFFFLVAVLLPISPSSSLSQTFFPLVLSEARC